MALIVGWKVADGAGQWHGGSVGRLEVEGRGEVAADGAAPRGDVGLLELPLSAKRRSMNRMIEVWSKTSEQTQPPVLQGETTIIGTRMPEAVRAGGVARVAGEELVGRAATVERPCARDAAGTAAPCGRRSRRSRRR